jgi:hypothetical protein
MINSNNNNQYNFIKNYVLSFKKIFRILKIKRILREMNSNKKYKAYKISLIF